MSKKLNCPNCGAPIENEICPYCGSIIYDFANIEIGKESYLRVKIGNNLNVFKAIASSAEIIMDSSCNSFYWDNSPMEAIFRPEMKFTVEFTLISDENGILVKEMKETIERGLRIEE